MSIESLCRCVVALDNQLLDQSFEKLVTYQDPIEEIFEDNRVKVVRESLDTEVFKIFLQNYVEAISYNQVK
jgi:Tfp pilus assembly ATPase PilU